MFEKERGTYAGWVISASDEIRERADNGMGEDADTQGERSRYFYYARRGRPNIRANRRARSRIGKAVVEIQSGECHRNPDRQ